MPKETKYIPYAQTVTITEHRAPTDESAIFLKELEESTLKKITATYSVKSSIIDGIILTIGDTPYEACKTLICVFNINGVQHNITKYIPISELYANNSSYTATICEIFVNTVTAYFVKEITNSISVELLQDYEKQIQHLRSY
jgi:hypothetical protein